MRPELEELPERMQKLPIDKRGYPVPWFVPWVNGEPEFRAMDGRKFSDALRFKLCWVCGVQLGRFKTFVIGPMCGITRTTSEPPAHLECARWSARNCPFLTMREVKRREDDFTRSCPVAGIGIKRNPGVAVVWTTVEYTVFKVPKILAAAGASEGYLLRVGPPESIEFYSHGRAATRDEVIASVESGFSALRDMTIGRPPKELAELLADKARFEKLYPANISSKP